MRAAQFLAIIGRGSKGSNALELTEDRAGATSEQQDNVINTVNSLDPYGPSWQLVPGNVAAGTVYAQVPTSGTGDLAFTRASTKTRTDASGTVVDVASGVAAIDYRNADGSLSSTGRVLLEPQRTNSIRNSTMVGAVAGSPGKLPTNWVTVPRGLTQTIVATGTINGLTYIDLRFVGTSVGNTLQIFPEPLTQIVAATGQAWTGSIWAQVLSQPSPAPSYNVVMTERTAAGAGLVASTTPCGTSFNRTILTRTLTNVSTERISFAVHADIVNGVAYDFTIRIAAPQMELGAYATTFIPTTTAAVTRITDAASKTGISSLIGQTEGALFVEINSANLESYTQRIFTASDDTTNNVIGFQLTAANQITFYVENGGANQVAITKATPAITLGQNVKIAAAYKANDFVLYVNGIQVGTDASGSVPATSVLRYANPGGANPYIGKISQAALFPTRLTNARLAEITTL